MKSYVRTTGVLFLALLGAHVARAIQERQLLRDPWFLLTSAISVVLVVWAWRLNRRLGATPPQT
jgi:hypothetical protein